MAQNIIDPLGSQKATTPNDTAASVSHITTLQPRFIRLPRSGTLCPFTGLSRTQMWGFIKDGRVKSHSLKRRGTCRGVRLIDFGSLLQAIETFSPAEDQEGGQR